jgi:hypothetical protein
MKNLIQIVAELSRSLLLPVPATLDESFDVNTQRLLTCLNRTAEDLTIMHDWLSQLSVCSFVVNEGLGYNPVTGGYNIQTLTGGAFDRFASNYIYDVDKKIRISELTVDSYEDVSLPGAANGRDAKFMRIADDIIFYPALGGHNVVFYYQQNYVCYKQAGSEKVFADTFSEAEQIPLHNDKLLIRGAMSKYKREAGIDNSQELEDYNTYLEKLKDQSSPKAVITLDLMRNRNFENELI